MIEETERCALRALTLCDGQRCLTDRSALPCYCAWIKELVSQLRVYEASEVRHARAVEVARAGRNPRYVQQAYLMWDLQQRAEREPEGL